MACAGSFRGPFVPGNDVYSTATIADVWGVSGVGNMFKPGTMTGKVPEFIQYKSGTPGPTISDTRTSRRVSALPGVRTRKAGSGASWVKAANRDPWRVFDCLQPDGDGHLHRDVQRQSGRIPDGHAQREPQQHRVSAPINGRCCSVKGAVSPRLPSRPRFPIRSS